MTRDEALDAGEGREPAALPEHQVVPRRSRAWTSRRSIKTVNAIPRLYEREHAAARSGTSPSTSPLRTVEAPGGRGYELMRELAGLGHDCVDHHLRRQPPR